MNDLVLALPSAPEARQEPSITEVPPEPAVRFRRMVDAHFDFIWRSLRGLGIPLHSVDDAAQQVFLIAAQKLDGIAQGSERSFLFSTALGVSANARRARARSREVLDEQVIHRQIDGSPAGDDVVEMREQRAMLEQVLASMPDDLRTVFVLFVLEGLAVPEIAELIEIPTGTVASRLRRAREAFHNASKRLQARAAHRGGIR